MTYQAHTIDHQAAYSPLNRDPLRPPSPLDIQEYDGTFACLGLAPGRAFLFARSGIIINLRSDVLALPEGARQHRHTHAAVSWNSQLQTMQTIKGLTTKIRRRTNTKFARAFLLFILLGIVILATLVVGYWALTPDTSPAWTGLGAYPSNVARAKTLWDWMQLLLVPLILALAVWWMSKSEKDTEREISEDRQRQALLEAYIDSMTSLLLKENLRISPEAAEVRSVARVRTLSVLRQLDGKRKGLVVRFLHESGLINTANTVITMQDADLSGADLSGADSHGNRGRTFMQALSLSEVNLRGANLSNAKLVEAKLTNSSLALADLSNANLTRAYLMLADLRLATMREANLSGANFFKADLSGAILTDANLSGASFLEANLESTEGLTQIQLDSAHSISSKNDS